MDKFYIVHDSCGEAFDSIDAAANHLCDGSTEFNLLPENEAM